MNFLAIFQRLRQMVVDLWQRTEKRDRNRFLVICGVSLVVIVIAVVLLTRTTYVELVNGSKIDAQSGAEIKTALTGQSINYKQESGGTILVPEKDLQAALAYLTTNGIPGSIKRDQSIYQQGNGLTSNSDQQSQFYIYQQEEYIRQFCQNIEGIRDAYVMLAIPKETITIVKSNSTIPTASVHLMTQDGSTPSNEAVRAVKAYTANAITGLLPENVVVTCQEGILLGDTEDVYGQLGSDRLALINQFELDAEQGVRALLNSVAGYNNFTIKANVDLNFDKLVTEKTTFVPSGDDNTGVVESMQTVAEIAQGNGVTVGEPGVDENGGGDGFTETESNGLEYYEKNSSTFNYRISEIREYIEKAGFAIENVTFSIIFDSAIYSEDTKFINTVKSIIGGSLGLAASEYGNISVMFEEFKGNKQIDADREAYEAELRRKELMELIRLIVLYLIIGVCVALLILKTYGLLKKEPTEEELLASAIAEGYDPEMDEVAALVEMATLGEITEAAKSPFREQIEKFIDKNPTAVAELLRNWINDEYN